MLDSIPRSNDDTDRGTKVIKYSCSFILQEAFLPGPRRDHIRRCREALGRIHITIAVTKGGPRGLQYQISTFLLTAIPKLNTTSRHTVAV